MKFDTLSPELAVIIIDGKVELSAEEALIMIKNLMHEQGKEVWGCSEIDVFPTDKETLLIVRPAKGIHISIGEYALPFLNDLM